MSGHRHKIVLLPPNRVWRSYQGGRTLDALAGSIEPRDSHFPEDWLGSLTHATNPDSVGGSNGLSEVLIGGQAYTLADLVERDAAYFLGTAHVARHGTNPMLLVKFLDPSVRLPFQVHPSTGFAQRFLNSASGKTEAYHVLSIRPEVTQPCVYIGFRRPPPRAGLKQMIETQDIPGLTACFNRVPLQPGDTFIVPGGTPHALGEGVFLVEIQEPSDLVVRFEFECDGYVLPESARFMNRGLDFCLDIFDCAERGPDYVREKFRCAPRRFRQLGGNSWQDELIGPAQTACFNVRKTILNDTVTLADDSFHVDIVTAGEVTIEAGGEAHVFREGGKYFVPAKLGPRRVTPSPHAEILECHPPL